MTILAGRYTQDAQIGSGGMGTVYLGTDITTEDRVAIKKLHRERIIAQPELVERFTREAEALRALNHPNIVKAFATFEQDGDHYIVMEYVAGKDLSDLLIQHGRLPLKRAIAIALGVTDALTRAHYLRITHRDLKPANVLLDLDDTPRLTDFGVAYWEAKDRMTGIGVQLGTPAYMSPEVINGGSGDPRADMWALGVMLYEMLAGKHPFFDGSMNQMLHNVLLTPTPDIQRLRPDVPDALADLLSRLLEKDPAARMSSARLAGAELEIISSIVDERETLGTVVGKSRFTLDAAPPAPGFKHNLPAQPTPLVGRDDDVREIRRLLESGNHRLVTLVGPGGMGKTRLALGVAHDIIASALASTPLHFQHGIVLVELAPLLSAEPLMATIANALSFQFAAEGDPKQQLLDYLREKELLLIADNFEHILDGAPLIAEILQAAPGVNILATSRERLNLMAETAYTLDGLDVPTTGSLDTLKASPAVRLFEQSAKRASPTWQASESDYRLIADICQKVGGLPLAIVLAAGWVQTLNLPDIISELGDSLDLLESDVRDMPTRHRSIRAVFDYSWQTMDEVERALVMQLSVFRGGFSRRAGQTVAGAGLRQLAALVNKSLLRRDPDQGSYHMHELLRQYAEEKLARDASPSTATAATQAHGTPLERAKAAHSDYYLDTLADLRRGLEGSAQVNTLHIIDSDIENVRAAWTFGATSGSLSKLARALPAASLYFELRGQYTEGLAFYEQTIALLKARPATPERDAVLGHVLARAAVLATTLHHADAVDTMLAESRALLEHDTQSAARAALEFAQGFNHLTLKHVADGRPHFEQAAALYRADGDRWALARTLSEWSSTYWYRADGGSTDFEKAKALAEEALSIQRDLNDAYGMASTLLHLGTVASYAGDDAADAMYTAESLSLFERVGNLYGMGHALNNIGVREMMLGDYAASRRHLEKSLQLKREIGTVVPIVWSEFVLARLSYNEAQFEDSLRHAEDGLALVRGTPHREWVLTLDLTRAQALLAIGRYTDAIAAFEQTLALAAELSNAEDEAFTLNQKGLAHILNDEPQAARTCLDAAITKAEALNDVTTAHQSRLLLAWNALNTGDLTAAVAFHAPAAAYFADSSNWVISYTNDEWQLATWAVESALITARIAALTGDSNATALLRNAVDAAERAFSPAHVRKAIVFAAHAFAALQPELAARLAQVITDDPRAYHNDRVSAQALVAQLGTPQQLFASTDEALIAVRQALA